MRFTLGAAASALSGLTVGIERARRLVVESHVPVDVRAEARRHALGGLHPAGLPFVRGDGAATVLGSARAENCGQRGTVRNRRSSAATLVDGNQLVPGGVGVRPVALAQVHLRELRDVRARSASVRGGVVPGSAERASRRERIDRRRELRAVG